MRVCLVTMNYPRYAGDHVGIFVRSLAAGLAGRGLDVTVVCPHAGGLAVREEMDGVHVRRFVYALPFRFQRISYGDGIPENIRASRLAKCQAPVFVLAGMGAVFAQAAHADVVHACWTVSAFIAAPAVRSWRRPMLLTLLGSGIRCAPRWVNRVALACSDAVACPTAELAGHLKTYAYAGPVLDIKHFPDFSRLDNHDALQEDLADWCAGGSATVTFIARLVAFKDPVGMVRAVPHVLKVHPGARFLIVGDGPLAPRVRAEIDDLGVAGAVRMIGHRNDVGPILRASTVFVANSPVTNCYSTTILEAMHLAVPVVVTDVGDPTGSFRQADYVELVRPSDPADFARGIISLLGSKDLRRRRADMGRRFLRDHGFLPDVALDRTIRTYEDILRRRRGPQRRAAAEGIPL